MAAGMFSEHNIVFCNADRFRRHYLVTKRIAQNAVLMNTCFVRDALRPTTALFG